MKIYFVIFFIFIQYNTYAKLGSYMYCVNKYNSSDWKWAPPLSQALKGFEKYVPPDKNGTWIHGEGMFDSYLYSVLRVADSMWYSDAKIFCEKLSDICTDAYGKDYSKIGASGYAVASWLWSYIAIFVNFYKRDDSRVYNAFIDCPH